jgi:hypothetical protein
MKNLGKLLLFVTACVVAVFVAIASWVLWPVHLTIQTVRIKIEEAKDGTETILTVSGHTGDSGMGVQYAGWEQRGNTIVITITKTLVRGTMTGNSKLDIRVPSDVNFVALHNAQDIIWRRKN